MPSFNRHAEQGVPGELSDKSASHSGHLRRGWSVFFRLSKFIVVCRYFLVFRPQPQQKLWFPKVTQKIEIFFCYYLALESDAVIEMGSD